MKNLIGRSTVFIFKAVVGCIPMVCLVSLGAGAVIYGIFTNPNIKVTTVSPDEKHLAQETQALRNPKPVSVAFTPMASKPSYLDGNPKTDILDPSNYRYIERYNKITEEQLEMDSQIMANPSSLPRCDSGTSLRLWSVYFQPINRDYGSFDWIVCQKTGANGNLTYMISKTSLWDMDMVQAKPVSLQAQSALIKSYLKAKN